MVPPDLGTGVPPTQGNPGMAHSNTEEPARKRQGGMEVEVTQPVRGQTGAVQPAIVENPPENQLGARRKQANGCYRCPYSAKTGKCDICGHINETKNVFSTHFSMKHELLVIMFISQPPTS